MLCKTCQNFSNTRSLDSGSDFEVSGFEVGVGLEGPIGKSLSSCGGFAGAVTVTTDDDEDSDTKESKLTGLPTEQIVNSQKSLFQRHLGISTTLSQMEIYPASKETIVKPGILTKAFWLKT